MSAIVSVVTPVHNTVDYLAECIESVLSQSHAEFEYVILDNCSGDGSYELAMEFARRDRRIRVARSGQLLPQAANYNRALGLVAPDAEFVKVVQADDWIYPDCISTMMDVMRSDGEVSLVSSYQIAGDRVRGMGLAPKPGNRRVSILSGREACRMYLLQDRYLFGTPTSVMYRAGDVRSRRPFYRESSRHEDSEACFELLRASRFAFVHETLSATRVDNDSMSTKARGFAADDLHAFIIMNLYGREYLSADEYRDAERRVTDRLYASLGYRFLRRPNQAFWHYHEEGFRMAGSELSRGRLLRSFALRLLQAIGNPADTIAKALRRL